MSVIASLRRRQIELAWAVFAAANLVAMALLPSWETIPFHFVWISLTLVYGFRVWGTRPTAAILGAVAATTGTLIFVDAFKGVQLWGELFEVPLMSAMFLAMVWHARRRQDALRTAEQRAEENAALLARQEQFLHDASHELRTPVTIARGHLELVREHPAQSGDVEVALDELERIDRILERLLFLVKADQPDFVLASEVDVEPFLEDVFVRWSEIAPRVWRLGPLAQGTLHADPEALRIALDALLENAVKYTQPRETIEVRARCEDSELVIEVADEGIGVPADALDRIFERFGRADTARSRSHGGVGLGLAITDAITKAHGGRCTVTSSNGGSVFVLRLPRFTAEPTALAGAAHPARQVLPSA
jgi:signal transduction histidine kinase